MIDSMFCILRRVRKIDTKSHIIKMYLCQDVEYHKPDAKVKSIPEIYVLFLLSPEVRFISPQSALSTKCDKRWDNNRLCMQGWQ